jgi:cytochrome c553
MKFLTITLLFISSFAFATEFTGKASAGKTKSTTCTACHGTDGNSMAPNFPKIAGQGALYTYKQLQDFKSGARKDATMAGMVAALSDQDMQDLAAYYAGQTTKANVAKASDEQLALGKKIYIGGKADGTTACIACHGPKGNGIPVAKFPQISKQHATYTTKQLKDFRQVAINAQTASNTASRSNDYEAMMQNVAKNLTNAEIEALAQYIAGLH